MCINSTLKAQNIENNPLVKCIICYKVGHLRCDPKWNDDIPQYDAEEFMRRIDSELLLHQANEANWPLLDFFKFPDLKEFKKEQPADSPMINNEERSTSPSDQWPPWQSTASKNPFENFRSLLKSNKHPIFSDTESDDELMYWKEARTWIWNTSKVEKEEKQQQKRREFDEKYIE